MIHVGFTGTRHGMNPLQSRELARLLDDIGIFTAHHGDCVGSDAQFHDIARRLANSIVIHPPSDESQRAFCKHADEWRAACSYLARNRCIVTEATVMIATPFEMDRQMTGGTWYTIAYAERLGKPLAIVKPNGDVDYSGGYTSPCGIRG